jgi:hypothetical protein
MKIIFLDIDGVLNVIPQGRDKYGVIFHSEFIENLKEIIDKTNAKIVISSSWRSDGLDVFKNMWKYRNYPGDVIDITPISYFNENLESDPNIEIIRGHEIKYWLNNTKHEIENYVILDDDDDMLQEQLDHYVKTADNPDHLDCIDIGYGLTKLCAEKAIQILNN